MEFICFTSSKGGVGVTQIVAQTATALSDMGKKCLAVDLHFKRRTLDIYIGCEDSFVFDIADVYEKSCTFDEATKKVNDNLYFMSCSQSIEINDSNNILDLIYKNSVDFDFVLIDMPYTKVNYHKFTKTILVTNCDDASVRCTEKLAQDLQNDKKYLIINKIDAELIQAQLNMNVDDICDLCGVEPIGLIPYDYEYFSKKNGDVLSVCCKVFENIAKRLDGKYACTVDFGTSKKAKKSFFRR